MSDIAATAAKPASPKPSAWVAAFVCGYLAFQVVLPLHQLLIVGDGRFGWRMFASAQHRMRAPTIEVRQPSGDWRSLGAVELRRYLLRPVSLRMGVERLPAHLCKMMPQITGVRFELQQLRSHLTVPCQARDSDSGGAGSTHFAGN